MPYVEHLVIEIYYSVRIFTKASVMNLVNAVVDAGFAPLKCIVNLLWFLETARHEFALWSFSDLE